MKPINFTLKETNLFLWKRVVYEINVNNMIIKQEKERKKERKKKYQKVGFP